LSLSLFRGPCFGTLSVGARSILGPISTGTTSPLSYSRRRNLGLMVVLSAVVYCIGQSISC
jgi:hypothetical protein